MPTNPDRAGYTALVALMVAVMPLGCATIQSDSEPESAERSPALQEIASALPGEYSTPLSRDESDRQIFLQVRADPSTPPERLRLVMAQARAGQTEPPRRFEWLLYAEPELGDDQLKGEFAPLDSSGRAQRRCKMAITLRREGLTGQTDPEACTFGEEEQLTGLLKEIAFDGTQLVIADRIVHLPAGDAAGRDQVTRFFPVRGFTGWAGVRDSTDWRMASAVAINTAADRMEPVDVAEMSLGIVIELAHYRLERENQVMLRLTVSDAESGELIGEAWADPDATSIGLALPELQVGLSTSP